jgi:hypothetical protein
MRNNSEFHSRSRKIRAAESMFKALKTIIALLCPSFVIEFFGPKQKYFPEKGSSSKLHEVTIVRKTATTIASVSLERKYVAKKVYMPLNLILLICDIPLHSQP